MKIDAKFDHAVVASGKSSAVHVLLRLTAPELGTDKIRPALNIAAVIDRSGSMNGEKLEHAKASVRILIDQLGPRDRFSLVAFDDSVLPLVEGTLAGGQTDLKAVVDRINCGGSTNLSGGWLKGIELVGQHAKPEQVNAVLLLTDGQANQGITDHAQLAAMGESVNQKQGIRTSCLGLGRDFDEDLLKGIAVAAGGRFHYIESADHAPEVFREELGGLLAVVAQNVEVSLEFADGVTGVAQLTGYPWKMDKAKCQLILGDFHAGQVKNILLVAQLPAMTDLSDMLLATMRMKYAEMREESIEIKRQKQTLIVQVTDAEAAAQPGDPEVLLHIGLQRAVQARQAAVAELDKGDVKTATRVLEQHSNELRGMAGQASQPDRLNAEADELDRRAKELRDAEDIRDSRKFMVAEGTAMNQSNFAATQAARQRRNRPRNNGTPSA